MIAVRKSEWERSEFCSVQLSMIIWDNFLLGSDWLKISLYRSYWDLGREWVGDSCLFAVNFLLGFSFPGCPPVSRGRLTPRKISSLARPRLLIVSSRVRAQAKLKSTVGRARLNKISDATRLDEAVNGWVWAMVLDGSGMIV